MGAVVIPLNGNNRRGSADWDFPLQAGSDGEGVWKTTTRREQYCHPPLLGGEEGAMETVVPARSGGKEAGGPSPRGAWKL